MVKRMQQLDLYAKEKLRKQKIDKERKEQELCTFKPHINENTSTMAQRSRLSSSAYANPEF